MTRQLAAVVALVVAAVAEAAPGPQSTGFNSGTGYTAPGTSTKRSLAARAGDVANVLDYGAKGDGTTDDTNALRAALASGAKRVQLPKPGTRYRITGALTVPSGVEVEGIGRGQVELQVPAGAAFHAFEVDGANNVRLTGLKVTKAAGADVTAGYSGVRVRGAAADVVLDRVTVEGLARGFTVSGGEGTTPGTVRRVTLRDCYALSSTGSGNGFLVDDTDDVLLDRCHAEGNGLDGFKMRRGVSNWTVRNCTAKGNGAVVTADGLDAYAGGDTGLLEGFIAEGNTGSGATIKTGPLTKTDAATYGYVRRIQVVAGRFRNNGSQGLNLNISTPADLAEPVVNAVQVVGGLYEGNGEQGIYCATRNTVIIAPTVRDNQKHGIATGARAMDVTIVAPVVTGNGRLLAGGYDGINLQGTRLHVRGGTVNGADADTIGQDSDYAGATKYTQYAVRVTSTVTDADVELDEAVNLTIANPQQAVRCDNASRCLTRGRGPYTPVNFVYGSAGSTWTKTDATDGELLWVKTGTATDGTGWKRAGELRSTQAITTAYTVAATTARLIVMGSGASIGVDRALTLPSSSTYAGMRFRVVRTAAATGAGLLNVNGPGLLKALTAGTWCEVEHDGSAWVLIAAGSL